MIRKYYAAVMSTVAAILAVTALTMGGAIAAGKIQVITSKDIKNGAVKTQDIAKNGVRATDIKNGAVGSADVANGAIESADIGTGEVTPQDVTMPPPEQLQESGEAVVNAGADYELVTNMGAYSKVDATSALQVNWTGSASAGPSSCVFQIRVGGATASGGGEVFVSNGQITSVSASALFEGLPSGQHQIEIWAKVPGGGGAEYPCTIAPSAAGIGQTFVVTEQII